MCLTTKKLKNILSILAFLTALSGAFSQTPLNFKELTVEPDKQNFFTSEECGYVLRIPNINPGEIQTDLSELPVGIKFVSSRKTDFFENTDDGTVFGTEIHFWFSFSDPCTAKLPPLILKHNGKNHYIPFRTVTVYENPLLISPVFTVEFENLPFKLENGRKIYTSATGRTIRFTVYVRYCTQILNFCWSLPKNSIFTETKRYEIAKEGNARKLEFSPESIPVATFEWKPLSEGNYSLPKITAEGIAYNGSKKNLLLPETELKIQRSASAKNEKSEFLQFVSRNEKTFLDSFTLLDNENDNSDGKDGEALTYEDCVQKADKISHERNFFTKLFSKDRAVFAGTEISTVPEKNAKKQAVVRGTVVKIVENAGEWLYIECEEFKGWTQPEFIIKIK